MPAPTISKDDSLQLGVRAMKDERPLRAEEICREYLREHPGCADHLRLLAYALQKQDRLTEAEEELRFAVSIKPHFPQLHEDLGSVLALQGRFEDAVAELQQATQLDPTLASAHRKLAQALLITGNREEAKQSLEDYLDKSPEDEVVARGAQLQAEGRLEEAIDVYRQALRENPEQVNAMMRLAMAYQARGEHLDDAEALLRRATRIAPDFTAAWLNLGLVLVDRMKFVEAIEKYQEATRLDPQNPATWGGLGNAYAVANYQEKSAAAFARAIALNPRSPNLQMGYGHVLKTLGQQAAALQAYRAAIAARPSFGEVYWSMANLKVFRFENEEVDAMIEQLENEDLTTSEEVHFRFALGKAFEDRKDYDQAWHYYDTGNQLQRMEVSHDPLEMEARRDAIIELFDREFIQQHEGQGFEAADPIFIVGLPRTGSTLVEQILASHSQVEGTSELPTLSRIANSVGRYRSDKVTFPESCRDLSKRDWRAYGKQYIDETQRHRETDRPFFTDKLPNNFPLVGFLHLVLPNAKVINARRHPYDSCLGGYKQLFGQGQNFTYDLFDLAHYYQQYCRMIDHWNDVLPGKVLDVHYEETVLDLEGQVHRILEHCGLPFEEGCLRFHETERAVRTASSEQVRQPIYTGALGKWRHYESHLDLWKQELGEIVERLPEAVRKAGM